MLSFFIAYDADISVAFMTAVIRSSGIVIKDSYLCWNLPSLSNGAVRKKLTRAFPGGDHDVKCATRCYDFKL